MVWKYERRALHTPLHASDVQGSGCTPGYNWRRRNPVEDCKAKTSKEQLGDVWWHRGSLGACCHSHRPPVRFQVFDWVVEPWQRTAQDRGKRHGGCWRDHLAINVHNHGREWAYGFDWSCWQLTCPAFGDKERESCPCFLWCKFPESGKIIYVYGCIAMYQEVGYFYLHIWINMDNMYQEVGYFYLRIWIDMDKLYQEVGNFYLHIWIHMDKMYQV